MPDWSCTGLFACCLAARLPMQILCNCSGRQTALRFSLACPEYRSPQVCFIRSLLETSTLAHSLCVRQAQCSLYPPFEELFSAVYRGSRRLHHAARWHCLSVCLSVCLSIQQHGLRGGSRCRWTSMLQRQKCTSTCTPGSPPLTPPACTSCTTR